MTEEITPPYPALAREKWISLNGLWDFCFDDANEGLQQGWPDGIPAKSRICVPFCYQAEMSGISDKKVHDILWYSRTISLLEEDIRGAVLLHFGAVDYTCTVWINGQNAGTHQGGSTAFALNIAPYAKPGENRITLRVTDSFSLQIPRGKQCWSDELTRCWYTPTSGIWQNVWLEKTGAIYIKELLITPNMDDRTVEMLVRLSSKEHCTLKWNISFAGKTCSSGTVEASGEKERIMISVREQDPIDDVHCWSPAHPNLYDVQMQVIQDGSICDTVTSYFGMRKLECRDGRIFLNNEELYQRLVLDQGYWKQSLMTPPNEEAIKKDIRLAMEMGFNGARKHQKFEDSRYYYWADKMGFLVWGECPSAYEFGTDMMENIMLEWPRFIRAHCNDPCVIVWVPLNESWGCRNILTDKRQQAFAAELYYMTKALDPSRLVSTNDGWETVEASDIVGIHDYEENPDRFRKRYENWDDFLTHGIGYKLPVCHGQRYNGQPILLTEYGGIAFRKGEEGGWGYHEEAADETSYLRRLDAITAEIQNLPYCCGFCCTQLTDVMQEKNGLLTEDRIPKVPVSRMHEIFARKKNEVKP